MLTTLWAPTLLAVPTRPVLPATPPGKVELPPHCRDGDTAASPDGGKEALWDMWQWRLARLPRPGKGGIRVRLMGPLVGPCGRDTLSPRSSSFSGTKSLGPCATYSSRPNLCFCIYKIETMTCPDFLLGPSVPGPSTFQA